LCKSRTPVLARKVRVFKPFVVFVLSVCAAAFLNRGSIARFQFASGLASLFCFKLFAFRLSSPFCLWRVERSTGRMAFLFLFFAIEGLLALAFGFSL